MTSAPSPAAPDLMTMLCRIGAGMREAVPSGVFMQFLLIGAMCPRFGALLEAWLFVEERLAAGQALDEADWVDDDGDDEMRSGWLSQEGPVWRWRHVTRFGSVLVIPVRWFVGRDEPGAWQLWLGSSVGGVAGVAGAAILGFVFSPGLPIQAELRAIRSGLLTIISNRAFFGRWRRWLSARWMVQCQSASQPTAHVVWFDSRDCEGLVST